MQKKPAYLRFLLTLFGNVLEHRDKALFTFLAPFIAPLFFPKTDLTTVLINIYGIFFLSLLTRPLGAIFFGFLADRYGRTCTISVTLIGMAVATFGIGCVPTYEKCGLLAPSLLALFRALQNFFAAGEIHASSVFLIEQTPKKFKSFASSIFEMSTMLGILLASTELTCLTSFGLLENGWRFLFWLGGAVGLIGWYFRRDLQESSEFITRSEKKIFEIDYNSLISIFLMSSFSRATYVMPITFLNGFLLLITPFSAEELTPLNSLLLLFDMALLPICGILSTKWGEEKMMIFAASAVAILAIPLFHFLPYASLNQIFLIRLTFVIFGVIFAVCYPSFSQNLLSPEKRCTHLSLGSSLGQILVEGFLTWFSLWVFERTALVASPAFFLAIFSLGSIFAVRQNRKSKQIPQNFPVT